jgi:hypothetical protein
MMEIEMDAEARLYQAVVWKLGSEQPGERISIAAESLEDAERQIRELYGNDVAFSLYNEQDANKVR